MSRAVAIDCVDRSVNLVFSPFLSLITLRSLEGADQYLDLNESDLASLFELVARRRDVQIIV